VKRFVTAGLGAFALLGVMAATPATGENITITATPTAATPHCVTNVDTGESACAATSAQADRHLGTSADPRVLVIYQLKDYKGYSHGWRKASPCTTTTSDRDIAIADLGKVKEDDGGNWDNRATSLKTDFDSASTKCSVILYQYRNFEGASILIDHKTPDLGTSGWNDRASSLVIT
jgi:hypothetical protein